MIEGRTTLGARLSVLLAALLFAGSVASEEIDPALLRQTAMLSVTRPDQPVEYGSGVVLCQVDKRVYLLTAHHVLAGKSPKASGKNTLRMRKISGVEISFHGGNPPPVGKDALTVTQVPGEDLLLLSFPLEQKLSPATLDAPPLVDEVAAQEDRPLVFAVGFWKDRTQSWANRAGTLLPGGGRLVHHTGQIAEGFSGGPLFNEAGALIGINVELVAGEAIGAEIGALYGEALVLEEVLPEINKWVPAECLKSARPLSELAFLTYRRAMRQVSTKRWQKAEQLLGEAIEQQPNESGTVHLGGLRYTPYLPLFHHGLALYKLARRADSSYQASELYGGAIRAWERSERQREIQKNKRYSQLTRLKERSYKALRRHSTPQTEEEKAAWAAAAERAKAEKAARAKAAAEEARARAAELEAAAKAAAEEAAAAETAREEELAAAVAEAVAAEEEAREKALAEAALAALRQVAAAALPCARLRTEPSAGALRIDCLTPGSRVKLLNERDDWSRIQLEDLRMGWVASRLLEAVPDTREGPLE